MTKIISACCLDGGAMPTWLLDARTQDRVITLSLNTGNPFNDPLTHAFVKTPLGFVQASRGEWIGLDANDQLWVFTEKPKLKGRYNIYKLHGIWHCVDRLKRDGKELTASGQTPTEALETVNNLRMYFDEPDLFK